MKLVKFLGDSREAVRAFPDKARHDAGAQLGRVQRGLDPESWKPMKTIGAGVREIRVRDETGAYRVIFAMAVNTFMSCMRFRKSRRQPQSETLSLLGSDTKCWQDDHDRED